MRSGWRRRPLVLVVDDMPDNREMYIEYLAFVGFRTAGASDGEQAIEAALKHRPSLILMDLSLPGLDGWEATKWLKADPRTRDIPVLAITGHVEASLRAKALAVGCDLVIAKPSLPSDVARIITGVLGAHESAAKRQ